MKSEGSQMRMRRFVVSAALIALATYSSPVLGQTVSGDLFRRVETLTLNDGTPARGGPVSISGDTAIVGGDGVAYVFEREPGGDHWLHTATLAPSDGAVGFGQSVATAGSLTVVGAPPLTPGVGTDGAAYVFQRGTGRPELAASGEADR